MKKLLGIIILGLLFCNVSFAEYCKDDDPVEGLDQTVKSYAERFDNYYVPEEAYKFGLEIQEAVKNKDLKKLLSLIKHDLKDGPQMSFFDNKTYDEAFPVSFGDAVLMNKPDCSPAGRDRGFVLGNGQIWYDKIKHEPWDLREDLMVHEWFASLSGHEKTRILRGIDTIYGPWTITRINEEGYIKAQERFKKKTLERNAKYIGYLESCSKSNVEHYILKNKVIPFMYELDIFESTNLNLDCLEKKFEQHLDETIIRKQDTVSNGITFKMIEIASLFSEQCGERCRPSSEIILIHKGRYWYMKGSNDKGVESKFINKDTILIKNLMTTHVRNYIFDINTKLFTSLPDGGLEFKKDHILVKGQKSYFEGGGAFWFDSKINYAGERIELISNGDTCRDITWFYEWLQKAMMKQGLLEFCVWTKY